MNSTLLVYPMFVMLLLTFSVVVRLFRARMKLVASGTLHPDFFKVYQGQSEPEAAAKLARHFTNLFEAPVLFYVVCLAAMTTQLTGPGFLVQAWIYVLARIIHTWIHTGSNKIWPRVYAYFASWIVLLSMWIVLAFNISTAS